VPLGGQMDPAVISMAASEREEASVDGLPARRKKRPQLRLVK